MGKKYHPLSNIENGLDGRPNSGLSMNPYGGKKALNELAQIKIIYLISGDTLVFHLDIEFGLSPLTALVIVAMGWVI